jgi:hypothetical protein
MQEGSKKAIIAAFNASSIANLGQNSFSLSPTSCVNKA